MQQVKLRKAAQISNEIQAKINELTRRLETTVEVKPNAALDAKAFVNSAQLKLHDTLEKIKRLLTINRAIRVDVSISNKLFGVDDVLAAMATYDNMMKILNSILVSATPAFDWEVYNEELNQKLDEAKREKPSYYGYTNTVTVSLTPQSFIDDVIKSINDARIAKNKLSDQLAMINVTYGIEIADFDWDYLVQLGIV